MGLGVCVCVVGVGVRVDKGYRVRSVRDHYPP